MAGMVSVGGRWWCGVNFGIRRLGFEGAWMVFFAYGVRIDGLWRFAVQKVRPALLKSLSTKE